MLHRLRVTAFAAGATLMVIELVGARMVAPYIGTSTFVWTAIIGVVLGSLSVGYWLGGRIADTGVGAGGLARILLLAAASCASIPLLEGFAAEGAGIVKDVRLASLLVSVFLFAPVSVLLGIITPYVVRLCTTSMEHLGSAVGNLYAIATLGSIAGTFLGGFILISYFSVSHIFFLCAAVLVCLAALFSRGRTRAALALLLLVGVGMTASDFLPRSSAPGIFEFNTPYARWRVVQSVDAATGRPTRLLVNGVFSAQSGIYVDNPRELLFPYTQSLAAATSVHTQPESVLLLGGGAYTYANWFAHEYSEGSIDVVEIDAGLEEIAQDFFGFEVNERINIYHEDARRFLNSNTDRYDVIIVDVFSSEPSVPHHLVTAEAVTRLRASLAEDGILAMNVVSAVQGEEAQLLEAIYATYDSVFSNVRIFRPTSSSPASSVQNVLLIAYESDLYEQDGALDSIGERVELLSESSVLFSDDFAPVERYAPSMR